MEFLNKIELRGVVGVSRLTNCGPTTICNFSLMTEYAYKGDNGCATIDTLWIQVIACGPKPGWPDLEKIQKGSKVHVIGRLRAKVIVILKESTEYVMKSSLRILKSWRTRV